MPLRLEDGPPAANSGERAGNALYRVGNDESDFLRVYVLT
jgi:hypothetical protein